jgi:hypothetical protein
MLEAKWLEDGDVGGDILSQLVGGCGWGDGSERVLRRGVFVRVTWARD